VGRSDLLKTARAVEFYKAKNLDFSKVLARAEGPAIRWNGVKREIETYDEVHLLPELAAAVSVKGGKKTRAARVINNVNRTIGARLSSVLARAQGPEGLPEDTVTVDFNGTAGQSFGAFLAKGLTFNLNGEGNDFVGKGLSGGVIVVKPAKDAAFVAKDNVIAGNVIGFGGTSGKIFINGQAGERFAIRNSGVSAVVEGVGDHGCEYMTGGRVVVLGATGVNVAAGMTGGVAYVYDEENDFDTKCNVGTVDLLSIQPASYEEKEILKFVNEHIARTGSPWAKEIVADWENRRGKFVQVIPYEYKKAFNKAKEALQE
jgi:glutamate synthase (NADPH/NADH) large chain